MRRDDEHILRKVLRTYKVKGKEEDRKRDGTMRASQRDLKSTGLRAGEETDMAMWRRKIISRKGDPT